LLEANPVLTPAAVKNILISTARRLTSHPAIRQGFGVLNAEKALVLAKTETHSLESPGFHPPKIVGSKIIFRFHDDLAESVSVAGDFSDWKPLSLDRCVDGTWGIAIDCKPAGQYRYKFLIDGDRWTEDPSHALKEDDGLGGFNSVILLA
jgi:1,4-alpha-glucan branching enzyme